jgi:hypothetical protein
MASFSMAAETNVDALLGLDSAVRSGHTMEYVHSFPITAVAPGLYLGSKFSVERGDHQDLGITAAINAGGHHAYPLVDHGIRLYETWPLEDSDDLTSVSRYLDDILRNLQQMIRAGHSVLVHCYSGMNRSALVCAAFLIREHHFRPADAIKHVQSERPFALQNASFRMYLLESM